MLNDKKGTGGGSGALLASHPKAKKIHWGHDIES